MRERPILFNTEMITAILSGQKTQTRRIMRRQPDSVERFHRGETTTNTDARHAVLRCHNNPKGFKGCNSGWLADAAYKTPFSEFNTDDRLWVRETFCYGRIDEWDAEHPLDRHLYVEQAGRADEDHPVHKQWCLANDADIEGVVWKPSIHMPRSACRLILGITAIRIERLNDISVEDALSEGIQHRSMNCPRHEFFQLWNSLYGEMSHEKNPWVWVIEFNLIEGGEHDF